MSWRRICAALIFPSDQLCCLFLFFFFFFPSPCSKTPQIQKDVETLSSQLSSQGWSRVQRLCYVKYSFFPAMVYALPCGTLNMQHFKQVYSFPAFFSHCVEPISPFLLFFLGGGARCSPRPSLVICERGGHAHHSLTTSRCISAAWLCRGFLAAPTRCGQQRVGVGFVRGRH